MRALVAVFLLALALPSSGTPTLAQTPATPDPAPPRDSLPRVGPPDPFRRTLLYVEAGGLPAFYGGAWSVNAERLLLPGTYLRAGAFYGKPDDGTDAGAELMIPVLLERLIGGARHHLEVGAGVFWTGIGDSPDLRWAATAGYRYQARSIGPVFRLGLGFDLGSVPHGYGWTLYPWPSASLGLAF